MISRKLELLALMLVLTIIAVAMTQGIAHDMGLREAMPKAVIELLSLFLLCLAVYARQQQKIPFNGLKYLLPLLVCLLSGWISWAMHGASSLELLLFIRAIVSPVIIFLAVLNIGLARGMRNIVLAFIVVIFLVQLPVAMIKFLLVGVDEKHWIGTVSQNAGQLGLLVPMLAMAYLLPKYLARGGVLLAALIFSFSVFAVVNEKRAIIFVLPVLFAVSVVLSVAFWGGLDRPGNLAAKTRWALYFMRGRLLVLGAIMAVITLMSAYLISSLRCDTLPWCMGHNINYASEYLNRDYSSPLNASRMSVEENSNIQLGRVKFVQVSISHVLDQNAGIILFGYGAGAINASPLLGLDRQDILFAKFGLRGTYPSAISVLWEAGFVGLLGMMAFFLLIGIGLVGKARALVEHGRDVDYSVGIHLIFAVMVFDYFCYSTVGWTSQTIAPVVFVVLGFFLADAKNNDPPVISIRS